MVVVARMMWSSPPPMQSCIHLGKGVLHEEDVHRGTLCLPDKAATIPYVLTFFTHLSLNVDLENHKSVCENICIQQREGLNY